MVAHILITQVLIIITSSYLLLSDYRALSTFVIHPPTCRFKLLEKLSHRTHNHVYVLSKLGVSFPCF
jgi:hypothetical protein